MSAVSAMPAGSPAQPAPSPATAPLVVRLAIALAAAVGLALAAVLAVALAADSGGPLPWLAAAGGSACTLVGGVAGLAAFALAAGLPGPGIVNGMLAGAGARMFVSLACATGLYLAAEPAPAWFWSAFLASSALALALETAVLLRALAPSASSPARRHALSAT